MGIILATDLSLESSFFAKSRPVLIHRMFAASSIDISLQNLMVVSLQNEFRQLAERDSKELFQLN